MGNYLTTPSSVKESQNGAVGRFEYGASAMQGWRISMEDAHLIHYFERLEPANTSVALFGIYDGHGGPQVAQYVARHLVEELLKNPDFKKGRFDAAFRAAYVSLDVLLGSQESQQELEWFAKGQYNRELPLTDQQQQQQVSPTPAIVAPTSHATAKTETATASVVKVSAAAQTTNGALVNETPQKSSFRTLSGKMFHRRGDKRRKTFEAAAATAEAGNSSSSSSSSENVKETQIVKTVAVEETQSSESSGSEIVDFATAESKALEKLHTTRFESGAAGSQSSTSAGDKNSSDTTTEDEESHESSLDSTAAGSSPSHSKAGGGKKENGSGAAPASANLFSFNGIRSLFSGIMKLGSSRSPPVNQGLAMLSGCTAVTVIVTDKQVVVANAGDSRCVLCRGASAIELSKDHKPQLPEERSRIYSAGGWLEMGRVNGNLNLSRALGDLVYKCNTSLPPERQIVSGVPDIVIVDLANEDEFLILGCDGIWESSSSQEIVDFIRERIDSSPRLSDVLEILFEELLSPNPTLFEFGCDNMTGVIVDLRPDRRRLRLSKTERTTSSSSSCSSDSFASVPVASNGIRIPNNNFHKALDMKGGVAAADKREPVRLQSAPAHHDLSHSQSPRCITSLNDAQPQQPSPPPISEEGDQASHSSSSSSSSSPDNSAPPSARRRFLSAPPSTSDEPNSDEPNSDSESVKKIDTEQRTLT